MKGNLFEAILHEPQPKQILFACAMNSTVAYRTCSFGQYVVLKMMFDKGEKVRGKNYHNMWQFTQFLHDRISHEV